MQEISDILNSPERLSYLDKLDELNWSLLPLNGKTKKPVDADWSKFCREKRKYSKNEFLNKNAGITTGPQNNLLVLDIDNIALFNHICQKYSLNVPNTYTVQTGSGGFHYYYLYPQTTGKCYNNRSFKVLGFDIRGDGGQVVAPYSVHPDTNQIYRITNDAPIFEAPSWLLSLYEAEYPEFKLVKMNQLNISEQAKQIIQHGVTVGERSEAIWYVLKELLRAGYSDEQIVYHFYTYPLGSKLMEKPEQTRFRYMEGEISRAKEAVGNLSNTVETSQANQPISFEIAYSGSNRPLIPFQSGH